jgi:hypothetical protein
VSLPSLFRDAVRVVIVYTDECPNHKQKQSFIDNISEHYKNIQLVFWGVCDHKVTTEGRDQKVSLKSKNAENSIFFVSYNKKVTATRITSDIQDILVDLVTSNMSLHQLELSFQKEKWSTNIYYEILF